MLFGYLVLLVIRTAVDDRNRVSLRITTYAPAKPSGHPHQMGIVQFFFRTIVKPPPGPKTARRVTQPEISVQHNPIEAVLTAG
jgi:hypothetical protein